MSISSSSLHNLPVYLLIKLSELCVCVVCICKYFCMLSFPTLFFVAALSVKLGPTDWLDSLASELWHLFASFRFSPHSCFPSLPHPSAGITGLPGFCISVENLNSDHHPYTSTLPTTPTSQPRCDAFDFKANHHFFPEVSASYCKPSIMVDPEKEEN